MTAFPSGPAPDPLTAPLPTAGERPKYFAVPDPLDPTKTSFWYRSQTGRDAGQIKPWPPRRSTWGQLLKVDVPHDKRTEPKAYREFVRGHFAAVGVARGQVEILIERDPQAAAAAFSHWAIRCCVCGKTLTDERSKVYGVGPDCRARMPVALVDAIAEQVRVVIGQALESGSA